MFLWEQKKFKDGFLCMPSEYLRKVYNMVQANMCTEIYKIPNFGD